MKHTIKTMTDVPTHTHTHTHTQTNTHTELPTSPPSAPKQIIASTQLDVNLFRLACVLKGTTTTAAAAAAVNSTHISCISQILMREGERERAAKGAVKQNGDASCLSASECEGMWQSAGGGFQIRFLLLSVHISRWRRICWFLLCSVTVGRRVCGVRGGGCWCAHAQKWCVSFDLFQCEPHEQLRRQAHTHTCSNRHSPAVWPFALFIALLKSVFLWVCVRLCVWFWLTSVSCCFHHRYICGLGVTEAAVWSTARIVFSIFFFFSWANYPLNNHMHTHAHTHILQLVDNYKPDNYEYAFPTA